MPKDFWTRFHEKYFTDRDTGCWIWHGAKGRGYGVISYNGKLGCAHRIAYEVLNGKLPDGLELDHLCKRTLCVNPAHLEPVTHSENCKRGRHAQVCRERAIVVTHCPKGHPYDGENLYVKPNGRRECRECVRESGKRYRARLHMDGKKPRKSSLGSYPRQPSVSSRKSWIEKI